MDFDPLLRRLSIRTDEPAVRPFEPNWAQQEVIRSINRQYNDLKPVRLIVLKARQLGLSTVSEAVMFWWGFIHEHSYGLVVAHEADASEYLLNMTRLYWDTFPFRDMYRTRYVSRKELAWEDINSSLRIATAGNVKAARSRTINALHASEVAFWPHPEELMLGLRQTIPSKHGSFICLESTANGVGNYFYDLWNASVDGKTEYEPLFFPWWKEPRYTGSALGLTERVTSLTEDERLLRALGVDDDHLMWRRWAMRNLISSKGYGMSLEDGFRQEYPATPEEAFVSSGTNVFPVDALKACYEPEKADGTRRGTTGFLRRVSDTYIEFIPDSRGPLTVFKAPGAGAMARYFVGGDPTHTTMGDNACAQVINSITYEQVAVWTGKIDPMSFAEELAKIGAYYNQATIATEVEGPGYATIGRLVEMNYPHIWRTRWADKHAGKMGETMGWSTTMKRKEWAIGWLVKLLADRDLLIHDPRTYDEMRNYVTLEHGGYGPANRSGHDDTVMALAIACICNATEGPKAAYESAMNQAVEQLRETEQDRPGWMDWGEMG